MYLVFMISIALAVLSPKCENTEYLIIDYAPKVAGKQPVKFAIIEKERITIVDFSIYANLYKKSLKKVVKHGENRTYTFDNDEDRSIFISNLKKQYKTSDEFELDMQNAKTSSRSAYLILNERFFDLTNKEKYALLLEKSSK